MEQNITILANLLEKLIKLKSHYLTIMPNSVLISQIDEQIVLTFNKIKTLNK